MAAGLIIPELLNHYNVYNDAQKLIGISGDVELPDFEAITETIEGAGVLGEIEAAATGQFSSMTVKIPFSVLYEDMFTIVNSASERSTMALRKRNVSSQYHASFRISAFITHLSWYLRKSWSMAPTSIAADACQGKEPTEPERL